jgi:hypothetical protein
MEAFDLFVSPQRAATGKELVLEDQTLNEKCAHIRALKRVAR